MVPMTFGFIIFVDLMSSPIIYIFSEPLDKCVVIIINILGSSKISIEFLMRNSILCPRWFGLSSTTLLHSLQHKNCSCFVFFLEFLSILLMLRFYRGVLPSLMSRMLCGLLHLLRILAIVILLTITILPRSPCCFVPGYQYANDVV